MVKIVWNDVGCELVRNLDFILWVEWYYWRYWFVEVYDKNKVLLRFFLYRILDLVRVDLL